MSVISAEQSQAQFLAGYSPQGPAFDELFRGDGGTRSQWEYLIRSVGSLGEAEFDRRCTEGRRLLHESGVTYNAYGETGRGELPWPLDPMPVLISSAEWRTIEDGLLQRAELLEAILADLYGDRRLIADGFLPGALVYSHVGYLRPCFGVSVPGGRHLPIYSADLGRAPGGSFFALGDRAQAPSGSGYALQNRVVMAHVLPSIFRDSHVHRLRFYFRRLRAALFELAPRRDESPHIVLLTPGPGSETYFEHTYLANYLGCTLVQGDDLSVIDEEVWLRTLDGRRRVDVILRRLDGVFCDPLELRSDSLLGTPGLLQAARRGNVAIVNPLGCSAIENPGLMAFLPGLAKHILGQDLKLPSVPTWWCGDDSARRYVLEHLDQLVVKPIVPHSSDVTVFGERLDAQGRARITAQIEATPHLFVGQEYIPLSKAPVVVEGNLEPRSMVVRAFVAADGSGHSVMPGGLCRVAASADSQIVSNRFGGVSKDVWVIASEPEREVEPISVVDRPVSLNRDGLAVGGRVADNLFWVGRYSERVGISARALREVGRRLLETDMHPQQDPQLRSLLFVVSHVTGAPPDFLNSVLGGPDGDVRAALEDEQLAASVRYNIGALLRAARAVRDQFSNDSWRVITAIGDENALLVPSVGNLAELERLLTLLAAFGGLSADSMTRGSRWQFLELGRCLERALGILATLRGLRASGADNFDAPWQDILGFGDSQTAFHLRYQSMPTAELVLDLLIDADGNPRSLVFQLLRIDALLQGLSSTERPTAGKAEREILQAALSRLRGPEQPSVSDVRGLDSDLDALLFALQDRLTALSDQIYQDYFSNPDGPRMVTSYS